MNPQRPLRGLLVGLLVLGTGCSTFVSSVIDHAADSSGAAVGNSVGNSMGNAMVGDMTPRMTQALTRYMFVIAFNSGGYAIDESPYKPGQYTRWNIPRDNGDAPAVFERAYLGDDADGNQWWKVKMVDQKENKTTLLEALFSADRTKLLRLRAQFPNDKQPKELPVEENTYGYVPPHRLTKQSLAAGDKGVESVTVPAGTFQAHHLQFGGMGSTSDWWQSDQVPGGTVKYSSTPEGDSSSAQSGSMNPRSYVVELAAYGDDATSELGSMK